MRQRDSNQRQALRSRYFGTGTRETGCSFFVRPGIRLGSSPSAFPLVQAAGLCYVSGFNHGARDVRISAIKVGRRSRHDMGDISGLARSISEVGLLHPVVITPSGRLIAGERRLKACIELGWKSIPVTVVDLSEIRRGELAENCERKNFLPSEIDAIRLALEPSAKAEARERQRQGGKGAKVSQPFRTTDRIGKFAGVSGRTVEKIRAVCEAAKSDPVKFGKLLDDMDRSGKVDGAYIRLVKIREAEKVRRNIKLAPNVLYHCDFQSAPIKPGSVDYVVCDPPYPREFLRLYSDLAACATRWLKPGGSLLAMVGHMHLPEIMGALSSAGLNYHWTLAYIMNGPDAKIFPRRVHVSWKPVVWFVKGKYSGPWVNDVIQSSDVDKSFHLWGQNESGFSELIRRFTKPGQVICDPTMGTATTGLAATALGRNFIGIENDAKTFAIAKRRLNVGK
jgi:ParB-like chromosome segregation protein Spo0J